jgi:peptidoglycan hydrolase-like protein with peptidoglycan-binding domain
VAGDQIPNATAHFESGPVGPVGPPDPVYPGPVVGPALVFAYPRKPLRQGSQGVSVKLVQAVVGAKPDGDFGPVTARRVRNWQKANGQFVDGVVGAKTWKAMFG